MTASIPRLALLSSGLVLGASLSPTAYAEFKLELLHAADQEAGAAAVQDAPRFSAVLNALRAEDLSNDGLADNTIVLSSGDAFIPGLFFDASAGAFGSAGIADIQIQNELGFQAIAFGNHEFDFGTETLADLIDGSAPGTILGADFTGAAFPYLSTNLDYSTDPSMAPLEVLGGQTPQAGKLTSSVIIDVNGEPIGVVGATTPTLKSISSPGDVGVFPTPFDASPTEAQLDALATEIQAGIDDLLAANPDINKVILLAHMQQLNIEFALAERLRGVDIIVGGGSNTRLFDENDRPRDGDSEQGDYPTFFEDLDGNPVAVVNTDGSYQYVGRLVIDFDDFGVIDPASYDPVVSGAYATDEQGVTDLSAEGLIDPEIQEIADAIEAQIIATESNVFGIADVFLNGNRSGTGAGDDPDGVRTQETNLGNLTADANLATAQLYDPSVLVSLKNGGGIRASIGQTIVPPGGTEAVRLPNEAVFDSDGNLIKPEGGISQNDIQTTLAFNNGLTLLTLTKAELVALLEHGVGAIPGVSGRFPQVTGVTFSYDASKDEGDRIQSAAVVSEDDELVAMLVQDGELAGDANELFRVVTLGFLAAPRFDDTGNFIGGGDGYPFPNTNLDPAVGETADLDTFNRIDPRSLVEEGPASGNAVFADDGSEQDALAEYLFANYWTQPFDGDDTGRSEDERIQNLAFRDDTVPTPPIAGDADGNGVVEREDLKTLRSFLRRPASSCPACDLDGDGVISIRDARLLVLSIPRPATVTNGADDGPGSLRAALGSGATKITIKPYVSEIVVQSPLHYDSTKPLTIAGSGQVIRWGIDSVDPADALLHLSKGADLSLSKLSFQGLGGYSITEQGGGKGVFIDVPTDRVGQVNVSLNDVSVSDTGNHGVHVRDCPNDDCSAGQGGGGIGSPASVFMRLTNVEIDGVGFGKQDADGVRVDDRGDGDIHLTVSNSTFKNVGADGIELDEGDAGSVVIDVRDSVFERNGAYCSDIRDEGVDPIAADPACDDDGDPDVDDAFDIDEAGSGGISGIIVNADIIDNFDEGLDFDTEGEGADNDVDLDLINIYAAGNGDEGIKVSEEGDASVLVRMRAIDVEGDVEVEEEDAGDLEVVINGSAIGDDLKLAEDGDGVGTVRLRGTTVGDELDFENVDEI
ncbi:bifunctional metallophosphatase/5'-nucleotidase [Halochromatium glycolicum]|nr:bifunctional metallophosphatase/5'-nucleotidase [Halochromatium glycolicum]